MILPRNRPASDREERNVVRACFNLLGAVDAFVGPRYPWIATQPMVDDDATCSWSNMHGGVMGSNVLTLLQDLKSDHENAEHHKHFKQNRCRQEDVVARHGECVADDRRNDATAHGPITVMFDRLWRVSDVRKRIPGDRPSNRCAAQNVAHFVLSQTHALEQRVKRRREGYARADDTSWPSQSVNFSSNHVRQQLHMPLFGLVAHINLH